MDLSTVQKRIEQLEKLQEEVKISREMLKGELENEPEFVEASDEAKAVTQKRKQIKFEILARGPNQQILATIKENQEEINTTKEILSAELMEYYEESKTDEFADRKFKVEATLLPKKFSYDKYEKKD